MIGTVFPTRQRMLPDEDRATRAPNHQLGAWTPIAYDSQREFPTEVDALAAGREAVPWLSGILDTRT